MFNIWRLSKVNDGAGTVAGTELCSMTLGAVNGLLSRITTLTASRGTFSGYLVFDSRSHILAHRHWHWHHSHRTYPTSTEYNMTQKGTVAPSIASVAGARPVLAVTRVSSGIQVRVTECPPSESLHKKLNQPITAPY
jgi:hypothetical protein